MVNRACSTERVKTATVGVIPRVAVHDGTGQRKGLLRVGRYRRAPKLSRSRRVRRPHQAWRPGPDRDDLVA